MLKWRIRYWGITTLIVWVFIIGMLALGFFMPTPAAVQHEKSACLSTNLLHERLTERYGETRQSAGLTGPDGMIETWANLETGSWTIFVTLPDGRSCIASSGLGFELFQESLEPVGMKM